MPQKEFEVANSKTDKIIIICCVGFIAILIAAMIVTEYILLAVGAMIILFLSIIGTLDMVISYVKVEDTILRGRTAFGRKYEFGCEDIHKVICSREKSVKYGPTYYITIKTDTEIVKIDSKMVGFQQMAEYLLERYEKGEIEQTAISKRNINALDKYKGRIFRIKSKGNVKSETIDGTLCQMRLIVKSMDDKAVLKAISPIFIWGVAWMLALLAVARLPYPFITFTIFLIVGISIIPISIQCFKKTSRFRKAVPFELEAIFITSGQTVSMNGKRVTIMENGTTDRFNIMLDRWSGYEVQNSEEFATFLRENNIPCENRNVKMV